MDHVHSTLDHPSVSTMESTRRYWAVVLSATLLGAGWIVLQTSVLLVGSVVLFGWCLTRQYVFLLTTGRTLEGLSLAVSNSSANVTTESETTASLRMRLELPTVFDITATTAVPVGPSTAPRTERTIRFDDTESEAQTSFPISWPIAGEFEIGPVSVLVKDPCGMFHRRVDRQTYSDISVTPERALPVRVGPKGRRVADAYGDHRSDRHGESQELRGVREYVPGDEARRIDWKATARLNSTHVREHESVSTQKTAMIINHSSDMDSGPQGQRKIDYVRHIGLSLVDGTEEIGDPLGLYGVGDGGITVEFSPSAQREDRDRIRSWLRGVSVTSPFDGSSNDQDKHLPSEQLGLIKDRAINNVSISSPSEARTLTRRLSGDPSPFARTLRPYFFESRTYVERIKTDPLFQVVRTRVRALSGTVWTIIVTDDQRRTELFEAAKLARQDGNYVALFLLPDIIFDTDKPGAVDAEYAEFQAFRQRLNQLDRVSAFDATPEQGTDSALDIDTESDNLLDSVTPLSE